MVFELVENLGFRRAFEHARKSGIELEKELQRAFEQEAGLYKALGIKVIEVQEGETVFEFGLNQLTMRRGGMAHGGVVMYALDTACGIAVMTKNDGIDQFTVELKVNFLEPLLDSPFRVHGRVIRSGRTIAVAEGWVTDFKGKECARALGTWRMLKSKKEEVPFG